MFQSARWTKVVAVKSPPLLDQIHNQRAPVQGASRLDVLEAQGRPVLSKVRLVWVGRPVLSKVRLLWVDAHRFHNACGMMCLSVGSWVLPQSRHAALAEGDGAVEGTGFSVRSSPHSRYLRLVIVACRAAVRLLLDAQTGGQAPKG